MESNGEGAKDCLSDPLTSIGGVVRGSAACWGCTAVGEHSLSA